jgi:hypothetical protein
MPTTRGMPGPARSRPRLVVLSADGSGLLAGITGAHPTESTPGNPFGRLRWTTWNAHGGRAWGAEWINDCSPTCGQAVYRAYRATVHVYDPNRSGVFVRMAVTARGRSTVYRAVYIGGPDAGWAFR